MTLSAIANQVVTEKSAVLVRFRSGIDYDVKPLFTGRKHGWVIVDTMTAGAMMAVYKALRDDLKPKFDTIPLAQLVKFCWRMVA